MKSKTDQGTYLFLLLWKAFRAVEKVDVASIRSLGLGCHSDFALLEALLHKGPQPINALGSLIGLTSGSITTAVQRLEKKAWIQRKPSSEDARRTLIDLSDEGRRMISDGFAVHAHNLERIFAPLNRSDRQQLANLLKRTGKAAELIEI